MSHRLQLLVPKDVDMRIRKAAQRARVSKGEWVRRAIQRALGEERGARNPLADLSLLEAPTGDIGQMIAEIERGRE